MEGGLSLTLVFVILTVISSYQAFGDPGLRAKLLFIPTKIKYQKEYYRLLSHGFIHADWMHLILNMFVLYMFGSIVEDVMVTYFGEMTGRLLYLLIYVLGLVAASLPDYVIHQDNYGYSALGASGTVSGIMLIYTFFNPWGGLCLFLLIPMPAIIASTLYLIYSSQMAKKGRDNIGHNAHFYGAIFGLVAIVAFSFALQPVAIDIAIELFFMGPDWSEYQCRPAF